MQVEPLQSFYEKRKTAFSSTLGYAQKQINVLSTVRLIIAGVFLVALYFAFSNIVFFYALPLLIIAFVVIAFRHSKLFEQKIHLENLIKINENELQALRGSFSCFKKGTSFIDPHHPYTHDLDIFGEKSLFQYINRSSTLLGEEHLAHALANPLTSAEAIITRQEAIKELAAKPDFRQHFLATGMSLEEYAQDKQQLLEWTQHKPFLYNKSFYRIILWFFPALTIIFVLTSFFVDGLSKFAIGCAILQWIFLGLHLKRIQAFHHYISGKKTVLDKYARLLQIIGKESFQSSLLYNFLTDATRADRKVRSLASLVRALDARLNILTSMVVNSLLLYDLQFVYRLEKWKEDHALNLHTWLDVIRDTDMLCSLGTFSFNHPDFIFPTIASHQKIVARSMGHPLIGRDERITNYVSVGNEQSILIITGANMAGKSTFLRTLGINMVLALIGAPVCAEEFLCPVIGIRSGMRTADSLQDHQSYFYAELNRLKTIMDELRSGSPLLVLLDEILKGTNSTDKQAGSIALVRQLLSYACLALIATHDLALGDLEKEYPARIKNYCFEPTIENDQLSFDYTLKPGLAQKMNATFLMKKMGIIPD